MGCASSRSDEPVERRNSVETMSGRYSNGIVLLLYEKGAVHIDEFNREYTAEELCLIAAKECGVTPVTIPLFGLVEKDHETWLLPGNIITCSETEPSEFYFRMRVKPHEKNLKWIAETDTDAFCYIFNQIETDFIFERMLKLYQVKITTELALGFSVIDMIRIAKEKGLDVDKLRSQHSHEEFLPRKSIEAFKLPWRAVKLKLNFKTQLETMFQSKLDNSAIDLKLQYVQGMYQCVPNYAVEQFLVFCGNNPDCIAVDPYHKTHPGIYFVKKNTLICPLDDIMDLSISISQAGNCSVLIHRKTAQPEALAFGKLELAKSFVALVDAYYRLTIDYYQHLSTEVKTSFVETLKTLKCHGPVGIGWVRDQLEHCPQQGSYLLKLRRKFHDIYDLFVKPNSSNKLQLFIIRRDENDGQYRLRFSDNTEDWSYPENGCDSVEEVMRLLCREKPQNIRNIKLTFRIRPSKEGDSRLLLCRPPDPILTEDEEDQTLTLTETEPVVVIHGDNLKLSKEILGQGHFSIVSKGHWSSRDYFRRPVAVKTLRKEIGSLLLQEFQQVIDKVSFWHSPYIVRTFGVCFRGGLHFVTELMELGSLEKFLRNTVEFKLYHAVSAGEQVAQALMYLEDSNFVHGSVRCHNVLVSEFAYNKIVVKLGEPSMGGLKENISPAVWSKIEAERFPWIDPNFYDGLSKTNSQFDMFSFGVAFWEMLSGGAYPLKHLGKDVTKVKRFYLDKNHLPKPTVLEETSEDGETKSKTKSELYEIILKAMDLEGNRISSRDLVRDLRQNLTAIDPQAYDPVSPCQSVGDSSIGSLAEIDFPKTSQPKPGDEDETILARPLRMIHSTQDPSVGARPLPGVPSEPFVIAQSDLEIDMTVKLGSGFYGDVRKGTLTNEFGEKKPCAVKFLKQEHIEKYYDELRKEIKIMTRLEHPNIAVIYGECPFDDVKVKLGLVMEYVSLGSLKSYLLKMKEAVQGSLIDWSIDIAEGMKYLTETAVPHVIHRDLAARNVLITATKTAKISDFGLAKSLKGEKDYYMCHDNMPVLWCPPEALDKHKFSAKSDVWSYGVTLWEMYTYGDKPHTRDLVGGNPVTPCPGREGVDWDKKDLELDTFYRMVIANNRLKKPDACDSKIYALMMKCWHKHDTERPLFSSIILSLTDIKADMERL